MTADLRVISIVDDDDPVRDSMRLLLETCGYIVQEYRSAAAFLDDPAAPKCRCLVLDLNMPEMDGLQLLAHLRRGGFDRAALLVTGQDDASDKRIAETGILATLQKPVAENVLLEWLDRACLAA